MWIVCYGNGIGNWGKGGGEQKGGGRKGVAKMMGANVNNWVELN